MLEQMYKLKKNNKLKLSKMRKLFLLLIATTSITVFGQINPTTLKAQIDTDITNKTAGTVTRAGIGGNMKSAVDYTTQQSTNKVDKNSSITGATKTKVTYDSKGLVTSGADATTADIADSTNKRYCTDAEKTIISNTSGTNTGDQDLSGYASTSYVDSYNVVKSTYVGISNSELLNLNTTAKTLLGAISGKIIIPLAITIDYRYSTSAFSNAFTWRVRIGSRLINQSANFIQSKTGNMTQIIMNFDLDSLNMSDQTIVNAPLLLTASENPADGGGIVYISVSYMVLQ